MLGDTRLIAGRYELSDELGRGGMGVVYRARDLQLGRTVAIKLISPLVAAEEDLRRRFLREAHALARVHHPGVVTIHDSGTDSDQPWLAMELCEGGSLADRLQSGPLPSQDVRSLLHQVAAALGAIHHAGIVHRDLKPANILRDSERWLIGDFGIAAATGESTITRTGMVMGTPEYWAPELVSEDTPVGPESDVYSLGCVLFHALTGAPPYRASNPLRTGLMHVSEPVPTIPDAFRSDGDLVVLIERMLQKAPSDRPKVRDLDPSRPAPTLVHEPGRAAPERPTAAVAPEAETLLEETRVARRRGGRRRAAWLVGGALLLVVVGTTAALAVSGFGRPDQVVAVSASFPNSVEMPKVTGLTVAQAQKRLAREMKVYGLSPPQVRPGARRYSETAAKGRILKQQPATGTDLTETSTVRVVLSRGSAFRMVPNASGTLDQVTASLEKAGFRTKVSRVDSFEVAEGSVLYTDPAAGQRAKRPGPVTIVVSGGFPDDALLVSGDAAIGGWETGAAGGFGGGLGEARSVFGEPSVIAPSPGSCSVSWETLGLYGYFYSLGGAPPCSDEMQMSSVQMTGPRFVTDRGLAIGSSLGRLQQLYPSAAYSGASSNEGDFWILATRYVPYGNGGNLPTLLATVAGDEVVRLTIEFPSGGD